MDPTPPIRFANVIAIAAAILFAPVPVLGVEGPAVGDRDPAAKTIVLVENGDGLACSGVAYAHSTILTAAHCMFADDDKLIPARRLRVYYGRKHVPVTEAGSAAPAVPINHIQITNGLHQRIPSTPTPPQGAQPTR